MSWDSFRKNEEDKSKNAGKTNVTNVNEIIVANASNKIKTLRANKSKLQEIRLHIPLNSKLTSIIYQCHHLPLRLGKVSGIIQWIGRTPLFNQPLSTARKWPERHTVTITTSPSEVLIVLLMFPYAGRILITALIWNHRDP